MNLKINKPIGLLLLLFLFAGNIRAEIPAPRRMNQAREQKFKDVFAEQNQSFGSPTPGLRGGDDDNPNTNGEGWIDGNSPVGDASWLVSVLVLTYGFYLFHKKRKKVVNT